MAFQSLSDSLSSIFKNLRGRGKLKEKDVKSVMREIRMALLEADVNYKVAKDFTDKVALRAVGKEVLESLTPAQQVIKIVQDELVELMGGADEGLSKAKKPPTIIMMCGLQGSGKTTHAGKLAYMLKKDGRRPLLVACDVYRPAAVEQLLVVGKSVNVPVYEEGQGDPIEIAKKSLKYAKDYGNDYVIIDTAGRLHVDEKLMGELANIKAAVDPTEILLVVDAMTGQDAVNVALAFNDLLEIDGVILTKTDGDTRGGAALSVKAVTGKPIKFAGTGEKMDEMEVFHPDRMASRILGMGDVLSLIEKAEQEIDASQAEQTLEKIKKNKFTLQDLLDQVTQVRKMGPLGNLFSMVPGMGKIDPDSVDEKKIDRMEAIIGSMTVGEKDTPKIINPSRKRRIAAGSGTQVSDVNQVLRQFEMMQKMMKQMTGGKKGRRGGMFGGLGGMMPPGFN